MRLIVKFAVIFLTFLAAAPTAFAGAGPPVDTARLPRKYATTASVLPTSFREDAGQVSVTLNIDLVRTFAMDEVVTITVGKANDSARPGRDYTVSADKLSVRIPAGKTNGTVTFKLTPIATGTQDQRRLTVSVFGERVLYTETYIVILPLPSVATPTATAPAGKSARAETPHVTPSTTRSPPPAAARPKIVPRTVPTPSPVPTPVPIKPESTQISAEAPRVPSSASATSARQTQRGCTEEKRQHAIGIQADNPTGPYCILSFDHDAPCYIMVYWEEQPGGVYGHTILYEGSREVDFLDFHPQCTRHRYN